MNPMLEQELLPASDYRNDKGGIDVKGLCEAIDLDQATLAKVLDTSRQSVSQYFKSGRHVRIRDDEQREFLEKLDRVFTLLRALTDPSKSREEIQTWFRSPNRALGMERPIDLVLRRDLDPLIRKLMDVLNASHGG
jgi:predicted transcriptional regulator